MTVSNTHRRDFLKNVSTAGAAIAAAPYIKTARAAGKLKLLIWGHWVPGAADLMRQILEEWGQANNIEMIIDTTDNVDPILMAEARANRGHDIVDLGDELVWVYRDSLESVDDVVAEITHEHGNYYPASAIRAKLDGSWRAVPTPIGAFMYCMVSRLDLLRQHSSINLLELFPAQGERKPEIVDKWDYNAFLDAAKQLNTAGVPVGLPISQAATLDTPLWLEPLFLAFGAELVDADGEIKINSDATRVALDYLNELTAEMPQDIYGWSNASNNNWIGSGRGASTINPATAWASARENRPEVAAQLYHHDMPRGPAGRFRGTTTSFWGVWKFSKNKAAAKALLVHLAQPDITEKLLQAGFDVPVLPSQSRYTVWDTTTPPAGVLYNYPVRGDEKLITIGHQAPPAITNQMFNQSFLANFVSRVTQASESAENAIAWAEEELESYMRV